MKTHTLQYTKLSIPSQGKVPKKELYCPLLDTFLFNKSIQTHFSFKSIVDSGADFCVFPEKFGKLIGLDVKAGDKVLTFGVGGIETLYFHKIQIGVHIKGELWKLDCKAGFSAKLNPKGIGLLGRKGFFDQFAEIAFNQNKKMFRIKE